MLSVSQSSVCVINHYSRETPLDGGGEPEMTGPRDPCTSVLRGSASGNREKHTSVLSAECVVVSAYFSEPAACCLRGPWKEGLTDYWRFLGRIFLGTWNLNWLIKNDRS